MPMAFMAHRVLEKAEAGCLQAEARCLQAEARPHLRHGQGHVPSWVNHSPHLAARELGLGGSMSRDGTTPLAEVSPPQAEGPTSYP